MLPISKFSAFFELYYVYHQASILPEAENGAKDVDGVNVVAGDVADVVGQGVKSNQGPCSANTCRGVD